MNPIYRHKLTIGATTYDVHPVYKDDMALDYQHESGELFFRANLSGRYEARKEFYTLTMHSHTQASYKQALFYLLPCAK